MHLVLLKVPYREDDNVLHVDPGNVGDKIYLRVEIYEEKFLKVVSGVINRSRI